MINEEQLMEWDIVKSEDHLLEVKDPEGWYKAIVKWDGCVHYTKYSNEPMSDDEENQDYFHICAIQSEIDRLYSLLQVARKHYKNHRYYEIAFEEEPSLLHQAELRWLTEQIERGEGMKEEEDWRKIELPVGGQWDAATQSRQADKNRIYNSALTDSLTPLIERKKEVEKLLVRKRGYEETLM